MGYFNVRLGFCRVGCGGAGGSANNAVFGVGGTAGTITVSGAEAATNLTINATTGN